jgi:hypothetical protein
MGWNMSKYFQANNPDYNGRDIYKTKLAFIKQPEIPEDC